MPLPFILGGLALAAAGYGVKKGIDALDADYEADEFIKKAENLKEKAKRKADSVDSARSSRNQALVRLGKKKLHVLNHSVSNFLDHFHRLERLRITIGTKDTDMQDLRKQISNVRNLLNQLNTNGIDGDSALGVIAGCGGLGASSFTTGAILGGGLAASGLAGMAVLGGLIAGPALAILGAISADEMEKKLENAKARYEEIRVRFEEAVVMVDQFQAIEKMAMYFTRQITKFDALFFSLAQEAIATMKKHNYDVSHYNQKENDQIATTYSTLMTLRAFLEVPIMDEHQKLNEATQSKLEFMQREMSSLETKHYNLINLTKIKFGLARRLFEFFRSLLGKNGRIKKANNS
ncbi:interferon alpha-inducible IFI6/IFI27 family protein [Helicobacter pylori]|uniref:interferon alpha-inducible IFI6/IFI27 family protein n=1 Tax=Helicobacter pylori TaxID=210 RepID=UPI000D3635A2|nr:interferon alpha-inducible IFI6/IFI27 family protein [Helicobacter pylori]PUD74643.1 sortase [Helicobacter pylori]